MSIIAPAGHRAIVPHPASVAAQGAASGADRSELPLRRRGLAIVIKAPAGHGAVVPHPAGVDVPGAHGCEAIVTEDCGTRGR